MKAGYVGSVKASIPLTSNTSSSSSYSQLNTTAATAADGTSRGSSNSSNPNSTAAAAAAADVVLDELYVTVGPKVPGSTTAATAAAAAAGGVDGSSSSQSQPIGFDLGSAGSSNLGESWQQLMSSAGAGGMGGVNPFQFAEDLGLTGLGQAGVNEGIRRIAGGLESLLQRLSVVATNVTIRVEIPPPVSGSGGPGAEFILNIASLHYADATPLHAVPAASALAVAFSPAGSAAAVAAAATELVKHVEVKGLTFEVFDWDPMHDHMGESAAATAATSAAATAAGLFDLRQSFMEDRAAAAGGTRGFGSSSSSSRIGLSSSKLGGGLQPSTAAATGAPHWDPELQGLVLGGGVNGQGLHASITLKLTWLDPAHTKPQMNAEVELSPVKLQLQPWQLPLLMLLPSAVASSTSPAAAATATAGAVRSPFATAAGGGGVGGAGYGGDFREGYGGVEVEGAAEEWGRRSFVEELFFPHCEGFVAESLLWGEGGGRGLGSSAVGVSLLGAGGGGGGSIYHDARSVLGSMANSMFGIGSSTAATAGGAGAGGGLWSGMVSSVSNTFGGLTGYAPQGGGAGVLGGSSGLGGRGGATAPWAATGQQAPPAAAWSVKVSTPSLTVALTYFDQEATAAAAAGSGSSSSVYHDAMSGSSHSYISSSSSSSSKLHPATAAAAAATSSSSSSGKVCCSKPQYLFPPRLVLECAGLVASADLGGRAVQAGLKMYCLEVSEHLPASFSSGSSGSGGGCPVCGVGCWGAAPAEGGAGEYARLPRRLPPTDHVSMFWVGAVGVACGDAISKTVVGWVQRGACWWGGDMESVLHRGQRMQHSEPGQTPKSEKEEGALMLGLPLLY